MLPLFRLEKIWLHYCLPQCFSPLLKSFYVLIFGRGKMSWFYFMTFSEPSTTVIGQLWPYTAMHISVHSTDITKHLLCLLQVLRCSSKKKKIFYWAYILIREKDNTMLDSSRFYRRKNKSRKQDRKCQGWDGVVDTLDYQWRTHWEQTLL